MKPAERRKVVARIVRQMNEIRAKDPAVFMRLLRVAARLAAKQARRAKAAG